MIFVNGVQADNDKTTEIQTFSRPLSLLENELRIRILRNANELWAYVLHGSGHATRSTLKLASRRRTMHCVVAHHGLHSLG